MVTPFSASGKATEVAQVCVVGLLGDFWQLKQLLEHCESTSTHVLQRGHAIRAE